MKRPPRSETILVLRTRLFALGAAQRAHALAAPKGAQSVWLGAARRH